jgi:hypothetical protein
MFRFLGGISFLYSVSATILSDSGCSCVITKTAATAPGAAASIAAGCSLKPDWLSSTSKWCLTDQVASPGCGTLQTGFGWADTCAIAGFPTFNVSEPPVYYSPDQTLNTFYTGQILTVNWTSQRIAVDEWLRITYTGQNLRTLTTGSGVNVTAGTFSARISDSNNAITPVGGSPIIISTVNPTITAQTQNIIVLQSRIVSAVVLDGTRLVGTGSITCDNRNVTIQWLSAGEAGSGVATVTIRSGGGGGGTTVGTPQITQVSPGNMTVNYFLPRTFTPSGGTTYAAQISVQSPGIGVNPYTQTSTAFNLVAAPSVTPTSTVSSSSTGTPTSTPSPTSSPTSSQTPTPSVTMTQTPTSAPSVDYIAIVRAATTRSEYQTETIIGASIGGFMGLIILGILIFVIKQRYETHLRRTRRLRAGARNYDEEIRNVYGVSTPAIQQGQTIMYQVNMPQQQRQIGPVRGYQSNNSRRMSGRRS